MNEIKFIWFIIMYIGKWKENNLIINIWNVRQTNRTESNTKCYTTHIYMSVQWQFLLRIVCNVQIGVAENISTELSAYISIAKYI